MTRRILISALLLLSGLLLRAQVVPGVEVLEEQGFAPLLGKRVGLVTNPSGVDRHFRSTIDILHEAPEVNLVALFGPEHGVRGDVYAGDHVADSKDARTGLPVHSLYGATREPSAEMLEGIDVMVYDIQDVGVRCYTFISTLGLVMRACAQNKIEVVVLDRPNPLGGNKVEGSLVRDGFHSFVSQYKIPFIYGLTVGELSRLINEEGLNCGQKGNLKPLRCNLTVVPMRGWRRDMLYKDTGLPWVLPSPNIPSMQSALCYGASGIGGEFGLLNSGVGYTIPFETFAADWVDADKLLDRLNSYRIPGVAFRAIHYKPISGSKKDVLLHGVQFAFTDFEACPVSLIQFYVLQAVNELYPAKNPYPLKRYGMLDKVCGTDYVRIAFGKRMKVADIVDAWSKDVEAFRQLSGKYYMYH
ncbi:MAG: DUF1343 domain-containing protein [Bacteroidales bacterium]|nr:DUF1343 domain-containing protein [Bacteroidales bacterium]